MVSLAWAGTALLMAAMVAVAALKAWRGWLDLKRFELAQKRETRQDDAEPDPAVRIEMANLKARLRKLESIAAGTDP